MKKLALLLLVSIVVSGCQKEELKTLYQISSSDYYPMSVGSYWIYEYTRIDTNGVETTTSTSNDSVYVSGDTIINGNTYSIFVGMMWMPAQEFYLRDSSGSVVSPGGVVTDLTDFSGILSFHHDPSGMFDITTYMEHPSGPISVPAGTFSAVDRVQKVDLLDPSYPWDNPRHMHNYYVKGIGLVRETTFFYSAPWYECRRLLRYHIQ